MGRLRDAFRTFDWEEIKANKEKLINNFISF